MDKHTKPIRDIQSSCYILALAALKDIVFAGVVAQQNNQQNNYGTTLATGIQDISAVAALFGTDICEKHVLNSLGGGWLYASAAGLSMFGSLGIAKAALITISRSRWLDALGISERGPVRKLLAEPKGAPLALLEQLKYRYWMPGSSHGNINDSFDGIFPWLLRCFLASIMQFLGLLPFVWPMLDTQVQGSYKAFPCMRIIGTYICSCLVQVIQLQKGDIIAVGRTFSIVLNVICLIGAIAVIVGYVGCFAVIQALTDQRQVYVWLGCEIFLMLLRLFIWANDTDKDDFIPIPASVDTDDEFSVKFDLPDTGAKDWNKLQLSVDHALIDKMAQSTEIIRNAAHAGLPDIDKIQDGCRMAWAAYNNTEALLFLDGNIWRHPNINPPLRTLCIITADTVTSITAVPVNNHDWDNLTIADIHSQLDGSLAWRVASNMLERRILADMPFYAVFLISRGLANRVEVWGDYIFENSAVTERFEAQRSAITVSGQQIPDSCKCRACSLTKQKEPTRANTQSSKTESSKTE